MQFGKQSKLVQKRIRETSLGALVVQRKRAVTWIGKVIVWVVGSGQYMDTF